MEYLLAKLAFSVCEAKLHRITTSASWAAQSDPTQWSFWSFRNFPHRRLVTGFLTALRLAVRTALALPLLLFPISGILHLYHNQAL